MKKIFTQVFDANVSKRRELPRGELLIEGNIVARTGIQKYRAHELGQSGNHVIPVYRPPEEVLRIAQLRHINMHQLLFTTLNNLFA